MPSLTIASPSTSRRTRWGAPIRENVAVAETGSVGPTIAPSTNAASQLIPGTISWATAATTTIVTSTRPIESSASGAISALSSRGDEFQPAACSSGGRKTRKTTSGSSSRSGQPGDQADREPADHQHDRVRHGDEVGQPDEHRGRGEQEDDELDVGHARRNSRIRGPCPIA